MDIKTKVGLIGVGKWGKNLLKELNHLAEIKYICHTGSVETENFILENYPHIPTTNNLDEILTNKEIEAIFIATPTETHFEIASRSLSAQKNVFLEKPGCTNSQELQQLVMIADKNNLKLAIGYEFVHHKAASIIKRLSNTEKVKSIHFNWFKWGTFKDDAVPYLISHDISILKYFELGDIEPINYKVEKVVSDSDIVEVEFINNKNIYIKSTIDRISPNKQKTVSVILEDGGLIWSNDQLFKINKKDQSLEELDLPDTSAVTEEIKDFLGAIHENRKPITDGSFALDVYKTIEKIKPSDSQLY